MVSKSTSSPASFESPESIQHLPKQPKDLPTGKGSQEQRELSGNQDNSAQSTYPDLQRRPKTVKQLSFRIDDTIHDKINRAAQDANKSINSWMQDILSEAADDALGYTRRPDLFYSPAIQQLIDNEELAADLAEELETYLQEWNLRSILRFNAALQKLLIGLDAVYACLEVSHLRQPKETADAAAEGGILTQLTQSLLYFLPVDEDSASLPQLVIALKKLLQGLMAIKPFLKDDRNENTCRVVSKIETFLGKLEQGDRP